MDEQFHLLSANCPWHVSMATYAACDTVPIRSRFCLHCLLCFPTIPRDLEQFLSSVQAFCLLWYRDLQKKIPQPISKPSKRTIESDIRLLMIKKTSFLTRKLIIIRKNMYVGFLKDLSIVGWCHREHSGIIPLSTFSMYKSNIIHGFANTSWLIIVFLTHFKLKVKWQ